MSFNKQIINALNERYSQDAFFSKGPANSSDTSAVLFLLGPQPKRKGSSIEPCLILNKRSSKIKQPGDLCCPGGSISSRLDAFLAKLLYLPGSPLTRWPHWNHWRKERIQETRNLALLFATSLRESFEEMRLNPLGLIFLGPLSSQRLVMFRRVIYPLACWVPHQKRFLLNWEVEKIIYIPIRKLLDPSKHACYRVQANIANNKAKHSNVTDYPCFIHKQHDESEVLWGATYRIAIGFLEIVFGFKPPDIESLPVVFTTLDENYLTGDG